MRDLTRQKKRRSAFDRVVEMALRHLAVDIVYIAELRDGSRQYRAAAGDPASFNIIVNGGWTIEPTYSLRLVSGEAPNLILDASKDDSVADLPMTRDAGIGSLIGVPLRFSDGAPYGALCGLSHSRVAHLEERDVRFLEMLAASIVEHLDEQREREELRARILKLIERDDVQIAYQPIFDLHSNECLGIEALARFPPPFTRPDLTFAAAETFRLNVELERLVVSKAWSVLPLLGPAQFLALNVAPTTLIRLAHRANIRDDICLSQVVVEVTEHAAVESYAAMHRELDPLRKRGLRIAVDDAGAGYASLRHVLELQPDFIKIDRSLIHGIASDHARRVAASAFLSLALDLGSKVVAEGVERPADLAVARELGIHAAQGYLLGKPTTSPARASRWIKGETPPGLQPTRRARSASKPRPRVTASRPTKPVRA
jgi:EAL domain-containing protein (putative c-di-GMP-specific phosphodiesterase class I)